AVPFSARGRRLPGRGLFFGGGGHALGNHIQTSRRIAFGQDLEGFRQYAPRVSGRNLGRVGVRTPGNSVIELTQRHDSSKKGFRKASAATSKSRSGQSRTTTYQTDRRVFGAAHQRPLP